MKQYLDLLEDILLHGEERDDRTGVGTISVFGRQLRFDMQKGFPAVTTKKLAWKAVTSELLWFLEGSTNEHRLAEIKNDNTPYDMLNDKQKNTIWTLNAENQGKDLGYKNGELGPVYGHQWRFWDGSYINFSRDLDENNNPLTTIEDDPVDQIQTIIDRIKTNPTDRRLLVSAWNVAELPQMALPPCHYCFQFYVSGKNKEYLSLMWNQRSVDTFLGLPFNIASYGLLLHIIAKMTGKIPYELIGNLGDTHVYKNHLDVVRQQVERTPHKLPELKMPDIDYQSMTLDEVLKAVKTSDFKLDNYICDESLKAPMAV
jgi:thymidylate synthase